MQITSVAAVAALFSVAHASATAAIPFVYYISAQTSNGAQIFSNGGTGPPSAARVNSFALGASTVVQTTGGGGAGRASLQTVTVSRTFDDSSPPLFRDLTQGLPLSIQLSLYRGGQNYVTYSLGKAYLSGLYWAANGTAVTETVTLQETQLLVQSYDINANGSAVPSTSFCFDTAVNSACGTPPPSAPTSR